MASIHRNDPCPCGSGKKYKKCHGFSGTDAPESFAPVPAQPAPKRPRLKQRAEPPTDPDEQLP